jgi:MoxR-like ATPase
LYVNQLVEHIRNEIHKVIVGQDQALEQVLIVLLTEGHALIEGVPGTAKTLLVKTLARIIGLHFGRIQFTPDLMPADVTGTNILTWRLRVSICVTGRYSQTCCLQTKSIAPRRRPRLHYLKRWKNDK